MIKHTTELSPVSSGVEVHRMTCIYDQDPDNYQKDEDNQKLVVGTEPGGYFYIKTDRWAFDNIDGLVEVLLDFKNKVDFVK